MHGLALSPLPSLDHGLVALDSIEANVLVPLNIATPSQSRPGSRSAKIPMSLVVTTTTYPKIAALRCLRIEC